MKSSPDTKRNAISCVAILIAIASLCVSLYRPSNPLSVNTVQSPGALDASMRRVQSERVLRVGVGGFPPYTVINPNEPDPNKRVTGLAADLINAIAERNVPPLKVEWYNFSWESLKADIQSRKFDVIADPVFQTIPRALDFSLCEPYSYFGIGCAVVRSDETRFSKFEDLDQKGVVVALAKGWTSSEFAERMLSKPQFKYVTVEKDAYTQCDEVLLGRADVALNDVPTVFQYVNAHAGKVKALWLNAPPSLVPGGFMTRIEDRDLRNFLNESLRVLRADGVLTALDKKWRSLGHLDSLTLTPGAGLQAK